MANTIFDDSRDDIHDLVVKINNVNIRRAEAGFAYTACDYTRTLLATICLHALENPLVFTCDRKKEIIELIDMLDYGSET